MSRQMLALTIIFVQALSYVGATKIFLLIIFSFLNQVGFKIDNKALSLMAPCKDTFRRDIKKLGCEMLIILRKQAVTQYLYYAYDVANKGGYHYIVKKITWYNYEKSELNIVVLDSDACDRTDMDTAKALDNSF